MINVLYEPFPESICADGTVYPIVTDFREWFRFADMLADEEIGKREKLLLMTQWLIKPPERITAGLVTALLDFYKGKELEPDTLCHDDETDQEQVIKPPVLDWCIDGKYILGDFRRCYNIDLIHIGYMHWWEFRCLFAALPDDSVTHKRMAYRSIDISQIKNAAERRRISNIQQQIAIPYEMDDDMIGGVFGGMI